MIRYRTASIDGQDVFYREAGDSAKPALLLLHGFPASSFMFRDLMARLEDRFHLVAPDYPGFGHSAVPAVKDHSLTFDSVAATVEKLVAHLGLKRYGLYMQDFGGPVGFRLAVRNPAQVSFLVVQNANAYEEGLPDAFWTPARELWRDPSPQNFGKIAALAMSPDALQWNYTHGTADPLRISPDSWELQRSQLDRPGARDAMLSLLYDYRSNLDRYAQWQAYFRQYQPPTLVTWGKNDVIFPETGAHPYKRDLRMVDFHLLDAGHFALEDHAQEIADHIRRFAAKLPADTLKAT